MKTTVMFTVLPRGRSGNKLALSLFVTPKLVDAPDGTRLGTTPLADWPSIIRGASYRAVFTYDEVNSVAVLDANAPEATQRFDSTLWRTMLPASTPVRKFASTRYERASFASFRTQTLHQDLSSLYRSAASSLARPSVGPGGTSGLGTRVNEVATSVATTTSAGEKLVLAPTDEGVVLSKEELGGSAPKQEYLRAAVFYNHGDWRKEAGVERPEPPAATSTPSMEFHQILGALGDHPTLLRRLGLVIDLVLDEPIGAGSAASIRVEVRLPGSTGIEVICPWTLYELSSTSFTAAFLPEPTNGKDIDVDLGSSLLSDNGMLPLDTPAYMVTHLDVDHAATEFIDFSQSTAKLLATQAPSSALAVGLPALRTVGFGIYRDDREAVMAPRLNRSHVYESAPSALNFIADELVRGYRFDVSENGGPWRSLCERVTTAQIGSGAPLTITDEGFVKATAMSTTNRAQDMFNVHESICRWNGWSLVARRPGRSVSAVTREDGRQEEEPEFVENSGAPVGMPVALDVRARPGSLPRLRFGRSYRFRARAVDLAGNDLSHTLASSPTVGDHASSTLAFKRYEPVTPPALVLKSKLTEGESLEHVVIRSNPYGQAPQDAASWAARANTLPAKVGYLLGPIAPYDATSERHVAPPKTSYQLAELHGAFDPLLASSAPVEQKVRRSWAIATKEEGTFYDASVMNVTPYPPVEEPSGCVLVTPAGVPGVTSAEVGTKPMPPRRERGDDESTGHLRGDPLRPGEYVIYPADAVRLPYLPDPNAPGFALHDLPAGRFQRDFSGSWPELDPARLVLSEGTSVGVRNGSGNAVTLTLPPATRLTLRYSSLVGNPALMELGSSSLASAIAAGEHALISPARELVVVHAVQQPQKPTLRSLDLLVGERTKGQTSVPVSGPVGVHGASTDHVELVASWQEIHDGYSDSDADPRDTPTAYRSTLCAMPVTYEQEDTAVPSDTVHAFGDTKRRDVTYKVVATTRYREYFPPSITVDPANVTNESPGVLRIIRSSARPPVPRVLYTVPNFRWSETRSNPPAGSLATIVKKRGGGLRVYVDRGWFATGADERLAVVLQPKSTAVTRPELVSVWGNDPIWYAKNDLAMLDEDAFVIDPAQRDTFSIMRDVATAEDAGKVTLVTVKPEFHRERKLWFFDIGMDPKAAYFPFVRLALARVQPYSVDDLRLSRIVLTEFAQLSAPRTTTLTPSSDGSAYEVRVDGVSGSNVSLSGSAPDPVTGLWPAAASGRVLRAELQESTTTRADELDFRVLGTIETLRPYGVQGSSAEQPQLSFRGTLQIPSSVNPNMKQRIVVREHEQFATDDEIGVSKGHAVIEHGGTAKPFTERLVYVDAISVTL
jgi:hypothetical protein